MKDEQRFDNAQAFAEGWGLFDTGHFYMIQRLDYPRDVDESLPEEPVFGRDLDAYNHVYVQSTKGSVYHKRALRLHRKSIGGRNGRKSA